jgi:NADPH-dependent glutamate synthase beta subunit-like oxidoreductase
MKPPHRKRLCHNIVYRRSRQEMPARAAEIHHAEEEGIEFFLLTAPTRFLAASSDSTDSPSIHNTPLQIASSGSPVVSLTVSSVTSIGDLY